MLHLVIGEPAKPSRKCKVYLRSNGGAPPPIALEGRVEIRGRQVRQLTPVTDSYNSIITSPQLEIVLTQIWTQIGDLERRGEHLEQEFKLDPRVSEQTYSDTFAVCGAVQVHLTMMTAII